MYQPHYLNPSSLSQEQISQQNFVETGSDASATGSYTFLAAVHDNSRLFKSKEIIDKALGADTTQYDLGILIGRPNNSRNGVAQLGSAISP